MRSGGRKLRGAELRAFGGGLLQVFVAKEAECFQRGVEPVLVPEFAHVSAVA